jgi:hypothetical protein
MQFVSIKLACKPRCHWIADLSEFIHLAPVENRVKCLKRVDGRLWPRAEEVQADSYAQLFFGLCCHPFVSVQRQVATESHLPANDGQLSVAQRLIRDPLAQSVL